MPSTRSLLAGPLSGDVRNDTRSRANIGVTPDINTLVFAVERGIRIPGERVTIAAEKVAHGRLIAMNVAGLPPSPLENLAHQNMYTAREGWDDG